LESVPGAESKKADEREEVVEVEVGASHPSVLTFTSIGHSYSAPMKKYNLHQRMVFL
jgi:hypothetical protein